VSLEFREFLVLVKKKILVSQDGYRSLDVVIFHTILITIIDMLFIICHFYLLNTC